MVSSAGSNLGAIGLKNGLAIEFDTWQNVNLGDPNYYHTRFIDTDNGVNLTPASNLGKIVDGGWHQVGVTWDSQAHTLQAVRITPTSDLPLEPAGPTICSRCISTL